MNAYALPAGQQAAGALQANRQSDTNRQTLTVRH